MAAHPSVARGRGLRGPGRRQRSAGTRVRLSALLAVLATLGGSGCASGPLTMDVTVYALIQETVYHLDPDGRVTVTPGPGPLLGEQPELLFETQLDPQAVETLKKLTLNSGFFFAQPPYGAAVTGGPALLVDIELGLWHNRLSTRAGLSESVNKILAEWNRHLPERLALPVAAGKGQEQTQRHLGQD